MFDAYRDLMNTARECSAFWAQCSFSDDVLTITAEDITVTADVATYTRLADQCAKGYIESGTDDYLISEARALLNKDWDNFDSSVGFTDLVCQHVFDTLDPRP